MAKLAPGISTIRGAEASFESGKREGMKMSELRAHLLPRHLFHNDVLPPPRSLGEEDVMSLVMSTDEEGGKMQEGVSVITKMYERKKGDFFGTRSWLGQRARTDVKSVERRENGRFV